MAIFFLHQPFVSFHLNVRLFCRMYFSVCRIIAFATRKMTMGSKTKVYGPYERTICNSIYHFSILCIFIYHTSIFILNIWMYFLWHIICGRFVDGKVFFFCWTLPGNFELPLCSTFNIYIYIYQWKDFPGYLAIADLCIVIILLKISFELNGCVRKEQQRRLYRLYFMYPVAIRAHIQCKYRHTHTHAQTALRMVSWGAI